MRSWRTSSAMAVRPSADRPPLVTLIARPRTRVSSDDIDCSVPSVASSQPSASVALRENELQSASWLR